MQSIQFITTMKRTSVHQSSSWRPRARQDAETSGHSTGRARARLTPAPKFRKRSINCFETLSIEDKDLTDHGIQNMCSTLRNILASWVISSE